MQSHTVKEWLGLLLETFLPQLRHLDQWEQQDKAKLPEQDLNRVVQRFRGRSFGQLELRYLRAEVRRRALRGLLTSVLSANEKLPPQVSDHFGDTQSMKAFSCLFPPSPNYQIKREWRSLATIRFNDWLYGIKIKGAYMPTNKLYKVALKGL